KAEYNRRAGTFVHAEARVTGDPAIRAGSVVEVAKAGKRVDGEYYVVSTDHVFFVDTGYATEFRAKRYTIKKGSSPVKNLAKFAQALQQAAQKAQEIADKIKDAAAFAVKAAREAAKTASQAVDAAALDAVQTVGDELSGAVKGIKQTLVTAADMALNIGKAGLTMAQAAILQGKGAIELCASQAVAMAKPMIEALAGQLDKVIEAVK